MSDPTTSFWRKCSSCKKEISFAAKYFVCSVSTCNGQRTGYVFCSVPCFERHLPGARHKDAAAFEETAPQRAGSFTPAVSAKRIIPATVSTAQHSALAHGGNDEVLIIASRLKEFIDSKGGMNTSAAVMDVLSDHIRKVCMRAIENARADGRKTLMDRDFIFLK